MTSWLDKQQIRDLFSELLQTVVGESDRGAVLIGSAHVENYMQSLFEGVFPEKLSKDTRRKLLKYTGPLSSFSARIDIAYATRLIPVQLYNALHALREIRNEVAHSPGTFKLQGQEERLAKIYAL